MVWDHEVGSSNPTSPTNLTVVEIQLDIQLIVPYNMSYRNKLMLNSSVGRAPDC